MVECSQQLWRFVKFSGLNERFKLIYFLLLTICEYSDSSERRSKGMSAKIGHVSVNTRIGPNRTDSSTWTSPTHRVILDHNHISSQKHSILDSAEAMHVWWCHMGIQFHVLSKKIPHFLDKTIKPPYPGAADRLVGSKSKISSHIYKLMLGFDSSKL